LANKDNNEVENNSRSKEVATKEKGQSDDQSSPTVINMNNKPVS